MPSTRPARISDFIKGLGPQATYNVAKAEQVAFSVPVSVSATGTIPVFVANGRCAIKRVTFIPAAAIAADAGNRWGIQAYNKGTNGLGNTALGTGNGTSAEAMVAFKEWGSIYAPVSELVVADKTVIAVTFAENGAPADVVGTVVVFYVPLLS